MGLGVVIDTSYLITLASASRPHHEIARRYWRYFLDENIPIFLSTIVVSEFCLKQEIDPSILRNCVILPFNWDAAIKAVDLDFRQFKGETADRVALKDDMKILAQAAVVGASHIITEDEQSLYRYAEILQRAGKVNFKAIKLADEFDPAFFNDGQRELGEDFGKSAESETGSQ
jgi:predicted nucleic acid-binding protein